MPGPYLPTNLEVTPDGRGRLRLTWTDDQDYPTASYIGYFSEVDDFSGSEQFGAAIAGSQVMVKDDLDDATPYFLWLIGVEDEGLGDPVGSVTATTDAAPTGELVVADIRLALRTFVKSVVGATEVIWRYEEGTKPAKGFVELHLTGPFKPGQDHDDGTTSEGQRMFKLAVRVFADKQKVAMQQAYEIQAATDMSDLLEPLQAEGVGIGEVGEVIDTSGLLENKWEARHEFEASIWVASNKLVTTEQIDTVVSENGLNE